MGEAFALFLLIVVTVGLAAPFVPFATRLARQCIAGWKDVVLVAAFMLVIGWLTFSAFSMIGVVVSFAVSQIISPLLRGSNIGQGAIAFLFTWVGVWVVALFCAGCLATKYLDVWWNSRS